MNDGISLLLTLGVGLFILIGAVFVFVTKNSEKIVTLSISMAFGIMIALIFSELIPDVFDNIRSIHKLLQIAFIFGFTILGISILKILDFILPNHSHHHEKKHGHEDNMLHIGLISSIALVFHNVIEGMALYLSGLSDIKIGLMLSIGIGLHNIPMGLVIASSFYKSNKSIAKTLIIVFALSLTTFFGGLIIYLKASSSINELYLGAVISITMGMLLYIALFELLPKMLCSKEKKSVTIGTLLGFVILFVSSLF